MLFKKLGFFSLSILLIVLITACSSNPSSTNTSPDNTPATPTPAVFGSTIPQESLDQAMQICNGEGNSDFSSYTGIPGLHPLIVVGSMATSRNGPTFCPLNGNLKIQNHLNWLPALVRRLKKSFNFVHMLMGLQLLVMLRLLTQPFGMQKLERSSHQQSYTVMHLVRAWRQKTLQFPV